MKRMLVLSMAIVMLLARPLFAEDGWREHKSRHFIIYYRDVPRDFVESVETSAENYYDDITRNLGFTRDRSWSFDNRAQIYIYKDKEDYINSGAAKWSGGVAHAQAKVIKTFPTAAGFFDSTLPHELGHIIFREFIGYYTSVPLWFEEGIASFQEKAKRWGANKFVKEAIENGTFMTLDELSSLRMTSGTSREVVNLFYAEAASVVYYMITELGQNRFVNFCKKLKKIKSFERALFSTYHRFDTLEDLNRNWVKYLEDQ